jgi:hypothetical protein
VDQSAEGVAAPNVGRRPALGRRRLRERWALLERAVRTVFVVVADVGTHDLLELAAADDQDPVEAFAPQASHPALGVRLRPWRPHGRPDDADALRAEHLVEAARELAVAVANEEAHRPLLLGERHHQVARLLAYPTLVRIRGHATEVDVALRVR